MSPNFITQMVKNYHFEWKRKQLHRMVQKVYNERKDVILMYVKQLKNCSLLNCAKIKKVWLNNIDNRDYLTVVDISGGKCIRYMFGF